MNELLAIFSLIVNGVLTACIWRSFFLKRETATIYSPLFWYLAFHSIVFLIRPAMGLMFDYWIAYDYMGIYDPMRDYAGTMLLTSVALLSYYFGHEAAVAIGVFFDSKKTSFSSVLNPNGVAIAWLLLGPVAIYSAFFVGGETISGPGIEMDRVNGVAVNVNQNGYLLDAQFLLIGLCAVLVVGARFKWWSYLPVVAFFVYRSLMGWGRWSIVLTVLALLMLWLHQRRMKWPPVHFLLYALPFVVLFVALGDDRAALRGLVTGEQSEYKERALNEKPLAKMFDALDFANFDYLLYIYRNVPESTGTFTYGLQHLQVFTEPVPRVLWKGKPAGAPIKFFDLNDYGNFVGLTPSIVGDGWMTGGYLGTIVTLVISGLILGRLYSRFLFHSPNSVQSVLYICFAALFVQFFRDGSMVTIVKFSAFVLLPIYVADFTVRMRAAGLASR